MRATGSQSTRWAGIPSTRRDSRASGPGTAMSPLPDQVRDTPRALRRDNRRGNGSGLDSPFHPDSREAAPGRDGASLERARSLRLGRTWSAREPRPAGRGDSRRGGLGRRTAARGRTAATRGSSPNSRGPPRRSVRPGSRRGRGPTPRTGHARDRSSTRAARHAITFSPHRRISGSSTISPRLDSDVD